MCKQRPEVQPGVHSERERRAMQSPELSHAEPRTEPQRMQAANFSKPSLLKLEGRYERDESQEGGMNMTLGSLRAQDRIV